jgi:hypothetical protein
MAEQQHPRAGEKQQQDEPTQRHAFCIQTSLLTVPGIGE